MIKKFLRLFGSARKQDQIPLIEKGFLELDDWEFASMEQPFCNLLYANDPGGYDEMFEYQKVFGGKTICNLLDLPEHLFPNVDLVGLKEKLLRADAITSISQTTQNQVKKFLDLDSFIVNNPAKEIFEVPGVYQKTDKLKFLVLGRVCDPIKRFSLVKQLMEKFYREDQLLVVGSENPGYGKYSGVVESRFLNSFYNHADIILQPSRAEGLGLTAIEGLLAGKFVITCSDNLAAQEFTPEFCCEPDILSVQHKILDFQIREDFYREIIKNYQVKYAEQFYYGTIVDNILAVYDKIK